MLAILEKPEILRHALPLGVAAYGKMAELGLVNEKTELIRGVIFEKMSKSPLHHFLLETISEILKKALPDGLVLRNEAPLSLTDSSPEPDVAVVHGPRSDYRRQHPATARLIIEIAVSSEALDREKAAIYAEAGVEEYWIVLPDRAVIERFTEFGMTGYARHEIIAKGDTAASLAIPAFLVNLDQLLKEG